MPFGATASARAPLFLLRVGEELGADRATLVQDAGLREADLAEPDARVSRRSWLRIWGSLQRQCPRRDLGLEVGRRFELRDAGLVGYLMCNSATLFDALGHMVLFDPLVVESEPPRVRLRGARATVQLSHDQVQRTLLRPMVDAGLAIVLSGVQQLVGEAVPLTEVSFPYAERPADLEPFRNHFRCALEFGRATASISFPAALLERGVIGADVDLGRYLEDLAEQTLERLSRGGSAGDKIERTLWNVMRRGNFTLEDVARELATSPRTLQRRLQDESTSFVELRDRLREHMARELVRDDQLAVYEVARLLGYSEPSAFHRAFRRWTGLSPQQYRSDLKQAAVN